MAVYKRRNGSPIELGRRIGGGGEGDIYEVPSSADLVAKIWANPDAPRVRKMRVLLSHPPRISSRVREKIDMAWPTDALYGDDGAMAGYLMPKVSLDDYRELVSFAFPVTRRRIEERRGTEFSKEDILDIARNLAGVFLRLHSDNYLIGDVNRANFLVDMNGRIFVIDIDSMQARDPDTDEIHRCTVGTPDFIPPELVGKAFRDFDRVENHDLFGLAVLIFELLMNGVHPYDPIDQTRTPSSGQMRLDNIKRGHSPYANLDPVQALAISNLKHIADPEIQRSSRDRLMTEIGLAATADFDTILDTRLEPWLDLSLDLRNLFVQAFAGSGQSRPSAREWIEAIDRVLRDIRLQSPAAATGTPPPTQPISQSARSMGSLHPRSPTPTPAPRPTTPPSATGETGGAIIIAVIGYVALIPLLFFTEWWLTLPLMLVAAFSLLGASQSLFRRPISPIRWIPDWRRRDGHRQFLDGYNWGGPDQRVLDDVAADWPGNGTHLPGSGHRAVGRVAPQSHCMATLDCDWRGVAGRPFHLGQPDRSGYP